MKQKTSNLCLQVKANVSSSDWQPPCVQPNSLAFFVSIPIVNQAMHLCLEEWLHAWSKCTHRCLLPSPLWFPPKATFERKEKKASMGIDCNRPWLWLTFPLNDFFPVFPLRTWRGLHFESAGKLNWNIGKITTPINLSNSLCLCRCQQCLRLQRC